MKSSTQHTLQNLIANLSQAGEKTAVLTMLQEGRRELSYTELADQVERLAAGLAGQGTGPGTRAALFSENRPEWILASLAVIAAGATVVPLDVQQGDETLSHILQDSEVRLVFTTTAAAERLKNLQLAEPPALILFDADGDSEQSFRNLYSPVRKQLPESSPEDQAALFYTSGTTGPPKGVPLSHANLAFQVSTIRKTGLVTTEDRILLPLPFHHVYPFVIGLLVPLGLGLPIILPQSLTGPQILRAVRKGRATIIIGVPRLYKALYSGIFSQVAERGKIARLFLSAFHGISTLLNRRLGFRTGKILLRPIHERFGSSLRVLASGGSALDPELAWKLEGFGWQVAIGYGLTETAPLLTINLPGSGRLQSVGKPVQDVAIRIDSSAQPNPAIGKSSRKVGEILAHGPNVFPGYRNLPDKNTSAFTPDGWFRTGDLGYLDNDQFLYLQGRTSTLIVTASGKNIQPDEVEEHYAYHPFILEAGVLQYENRLAAVVVPDLTELRRAGEKDIDEAIHRAVKEQGRKLASYQRLDEYVVSRDVLARTRLGKIRRHLLPGRYEEARISREGKGRKQSGPISPEEMSDHDRLLLDVPAAGTVWNWLSRRYPEERLTPDTSPDLDLGIDSLEWLNLTVEIGQRTGVELREEAIGRIETVRDLLEEVAGQVKQGEALSPDHILENPEEIIEDRQRHWLKPLNPVQLIPAFGLYLLNKLVMRTIFRLKVEGSEHVPPDRPFVLTPNHVSFLDPFVIAAALPFSVLRRSFFAGWTGIAFRNFLFRFVSRLAQAVPIDRRQAVASSLAFGAEVLKGKNNLIWFPEGERSRDGKLQELKPGIAMLLDHYRVPVIPAFIRGAYEAMPASRILPRPGKISITFDRPVEPDFLVAGEEEDPREGIRRGLQEQLASLRERTK